MKKIIMSLVVISLFTITLTGCGKSNNADSEETPKNEPVDNEVVIKQDVINVLQTSLKYDKKNKVTVVEFKVTNISDKSEYVDSIEVTYVIDYNPIKTKVSIKDTLAPGQEIELSITSEYDLTEIGNLEYKVLGK